MNVQIKILHPLASVPERGTALSAGYDLIAAIDKPISIRHCNKAIMIPTGVSIFIDSPNVAGFIFARSGLAHKAGLALSNGVGLVDGDYQNQWFVSAYNRGQNDEVIINPGDRIAQVVFVPVLHPGFDVVEEFTHVTGRGQGGFGSTAGFTHVETALGIK